jgi:hypothetical protein
MMPTFQNLESAMEAASDLENFTITSTLRIYFCRRLHYPLLKGLPEGNTQQLVAHQENGPTAESGESILGRSL